MGPNSLIPAKQKCIAIVRTGWYNVARKGDTKVFERGLKLWQLKQLICMQELSRM